MPVSYGSFNILEQIIMSEINRPDAATAPRIEVYRRSISAEVLRNRLSDISDEPHFSIRSLRASQDEGTDLTPFFALDPLANRTERKVIELLFSRYSTCSRDSRRHAVFTFSLPVPVGDAHVIYYAANFGFLAGHDSICRFEGSFESPASLEFHPLRQS